MVQKHSVYSVPVAVFNVARHSLELGYCRKYLEAISTSLIMWLVLLPSISDSASPTTDPEETLPVGYTQCSRITER